MVAARVPRREVLAGRPVKERPVRHLELFVARLQRTLLVLVPLPTASFAEVAGGGLGVRGIAQKVHGKIRVLIQGLRGIATRKSAETSRCQQEGGEGRGA